MAAQFRADDGLNDTPVSSTNPLPVGGFATGWRDDGSESGVQRVEPVRGGLLMLPFRRGYYDSANTNGAISFNGNFVDNDDGSSTGLLIQVTHNAALGNYAKIAFWFMGSVFALRFAPDRSTQTQIGLTIDGRAIETPVQPCINPISAAQGLAFGSYRTPLVTDLGEGPHYVEMHFPCDAVTDLTWRVWGYVVDASAGYSPPIRAGRIGATQKTLTTSLVSIATAASDSVNIQVARVIWLRNSSASAVIVDLAHSTYGTFYSDSVPANGTVRVDLGQDHSDFTEIQAKAATGAVIILTIGGR